jgi:catechol 2,3-dioxygenase-like lactoylglutathione lyase family enzyme
VSFHHVDLVVTDLERAREFYGRVLAPLGYRSWSRVDGERGEDIWYLNSRQSAVGLRARQSDAHPVPYDRYAVGVHHVCFGARSRAVVDECAAVLRDAGAEIESGPQEYDYMDEYYAVFFHDPDGLKLEIAHAPYPS